MKAEYILISLFALGVSIILWGLFVGLRSDYVDNRCREAGYSWGTFHDTTFKSFCYGKVGNDYGYIPFKDAIK